MFKGSDGASAFQAYHFGYSKQADQWKVDPLNRILTDIVQT